MRIIKYLFLLIVLAVIAVSVYVATQKGNFDITKSTVINVPKSVVFNYVNDYRNWEDWSAWKQDDPGMAFTYGESSVGKGATYSWSGSDSEGKATTVFVKENDSIAQRINYSGIESNAYITFKDTAGKTKVTWHSKGRLSFMSKVRATFNGGINQLVDGMYERSLENLRKLITTEMTTFSIKVNGITQKTGTYYIKQTIKCKPEDVQSKLLLVLPRIVRFFKRNNMTMNGSPFVIYENFDAANGFVTFSVCGPVHEQVYFSAGSDMVAGKLEPFSALKVTLTGDYSHRLEAEKKAVEYMIANNIQRNASLKEIDVYVKSATDIKSPSKWVTELLIPLTSTVAPITTPVQVATPPAIIEEPIITD